MVHHIPSTDPGEILHMTAPNCTRKLSRSDTHYPLSTPRRHRALSATETILNGDGTVTSGPQKLSVRVRVPASWEERDVWRDPVKDEVACGHNHGKRMSRKPGKSLEDLPLEIQGSILDYLFGEIHSVTSTSTPLKSGVKHLSSAMRHPRRKALTDVALVSPTWRDLVQERIYRHIKIKGNRVGLAESSDWFSEHFQLTRHVRHVEFWVPVWAEKSPGRRKSLFLDVQPGMIHATSLLSLQNRGFSLTNSSVREIDHQTHTSRRPIAGLTDDESRGCTYPFSSGCTSATLSEIFSHVACFFSQAPIFTLEGGHCKKSNMIRQFPAALFPASDRRLDVLPNVRKFAMRGAWNIMREYAHWAVIEKALPGIQEWHCSYAKPRPEAYMTINSILAHFPITLKHVSISLDGFYCKDGGEEDGTMGSTQSMLVTEHLCERLGRIAPQLESLSFTGRICECFFRSAMEVAKARRQASPLQAVDMVVKSCCRLVVVSKHPVKEHSEGVPDAEHDAGETASSDFSTTVATDTAATTQLLVPSPLESDTLSSVTNLTFIRSFERLTLSAVRSLNLSCLPALSHIRIRSIDLDSAWPLLNPYFVFSGPDGGRCAGMWNDEIVDALEKNRPGAAGWDDFADEIDRGGDDKPADSTDPLGDAGRGGDGGGNSWGVRRKPRAIKASAYSVLVDNNL